MTFIVYALALLLLAALPAAMVFRNLKLFGRAADVVSDGRAVSVLIPARNEESGIAAAIESVLSNQHDRFQIIVLDDHSTDRTAEIVTQIAERDQRVQLAASAPLPDGWNGKQHACWQLSQLASHDWLLFVDADVRLSPDAIGRLLAEQSRSQASLLSGFPEQITPTLAEQLLVPTMYVVLLGYLPLDQMRSSRQVGLGAGCGQLFLAEKKSYMLAGGHAAIRSSRHDGLKLPRAFRAAGLSTDLFDACDIARVRMYSGWQSVMQGLQKNANEGIANSKLIFVFSILLLGGAVLPALSLPHAVYYRWPQIAIILLAVATVLSFLPRVAIAVRFAQPILSVLLHPLAIAIFVGVQWIAYMRDLLGLAPVRWRGRV